MTLAWYAAYGSNTDEERFREYLLRCTQPAEPVESRPYVIDLPLYFAGTTNQRWGDGGVAFTGPERDPEPSTLARAWLLPLDRVKEIKKLEGRWYDAWMDCGSIDGIRVVTFTGSVARTPVNPPSQHYVQVVARGLRATHGLSPEQVAAYLSPRTKHPIDTLIGWQAAGTRYHDLTSPPCPSTAQGPSGPSSGEQGLSTESASSTSPACTPVRTAGARSPTSAPTSSRSNRPTAT